MKYLARHTVDLPDSIWDGIDRAVKDSAVATLVGRRFLEILGPLGPGMTAIQIDDTDAGEVSEDGYTKTRGRRYVELPLISQDFWLNWRDLEAAQRQQIPVDFSVVRQAARRLASKEDQLIFHGNAFLGAEGLLNTGGVARIEIGSWGEGENAFRQVADGLASFQSKSLLGRYVLITSPDVYASLFRVQPGLGITEADRIRKMLQDRLMIAPVLGHHKAVLACSEAEHMDLVVGKDIETAYAETVDLNHHFRIIESAALRLKNKDAVIVFE